MPGSELGQLPNGLLLSTTSKQTPSPTVLRFTDPFFLKLIKMMFYDFVSIKMNVFQDRSFSFFFFMIFKETKIFVWALRRIVHFGRVPSVPCSPLCWPLPVTGFSAAAHPEHAGRSFLQQWSPDAGTPRAFIPPLSSADSDPGFPWRISAPQSQASNALA